MRHDLRLDRWLVPMALCISLAPVLCSAAEVVKTRRALEWRTESGEAVASGVEVYESAPAWARYELDVTLAQASIEVTHTYDPWQDRHTTRLHDEESGWWVAYTTLSELSFATTSEARSEGPIRMLQENPRITVELQTSDGWHREISGPARMPGPAAEKRLHSGPPLPLPAIPESALRGLLLLDRTVDRARSSKVALIQPLLDAVEPWLAETRSHTQANNDLVLIEGSPLAIEP